MNLAGQDILGQILPTQASWTDLARKPALYFDDQVYTYAELDAASANAAARLRERAIGPGHVVALILPNSPALVCFLFGILRIGATVLPLNPSLKPGEMALVLDESRAGAVITSSALADALDDLRARCPALAQVIAVDPFQRLDCAVSAPAPDLAGSPAQTAFLIYTAGTTGRSKGVILSHRNVLANTTQVAERTNLTQADRVLHVMPLFHTNGLMNNTILPLRVGASIVLRPRFDVDEFWHVVASFRPTYFTAVPTVFARLMDAWDGRADTTSLRFVRSGAAPMMPALQHEVEERLQVPVVLSYGLSEATCTCTMNPPGWERRAGSVGPALPNEIVAVVDEQDQPQPPGQVGDVVVRGPNVMAGYFNAPQATEQALRAGWLRTGDMGYLDADGFLFLTDRRKDLIIRGGENISPREVEEVLLMHGDVAEVAVVGAPHREWGEEVVAFVVRKAGAEVALDALDALCRERLTRFKVPASIHLVPALPLTAVGKIDKVRLRAAHSETPR